MRTMQLLAFFLLISLAFAENAQFRIAGVVVDGSTGFPLAKVHMSTFAQPRTLGEPITQDQSMVTGSDGKFSFSVVGTGKFSLFAQRNGGLRQIYRADAGSRSAVGVSIVTGPNEVTDQIRFRYYAAGSISGRVLEPSGEPVENALVQLIRQSITAGKRRSVPAGYSYTNDLGEFRFGQLAGGSYYLSVSGSPWYSESVGNDAGAYPPIFYPGATDVRRAEAVNVTPGENYVANFQFRSETAHTVTLEWPKDRNNVLVQLISDGVDGVDAYQEVKDCSSGTCKISGVPTGKYKIRVRSGEGQQQEIALETLEISQDVSVSVRFDSVDPIQGKVTIKSGDPNDLPRLLAGLRLMDNTGGWTRAVDKNGSFAMPRLFPGSYRVTITGAGYIADEDRVIDLKAGPQPVLAITASKGIGRVKGLLTKGGKPYAAGMVVLAPVEMKTGDLRYRGFLTDSDGTFDFLNVRPGEYILLSSSNSELEYTNPSSLKPFADQGKLLQIGPGDTFSEALEIK